MGLLDRVRRKESGADPVPKRTAQRPGPAIVPPTTPAPEATQVPPAGPPVAPVAAQAPPAAPPAVQAAGPPAQAPAAASPSPSIARAASPGEHGKTGGGQSEGEGHRELSEAGWFTPEQIKRLEKLMEEKHKAEEEGDEDGEDEDEDSESEDPPEQDDDRDEPPRTRRPARPEPRKGAPKERSRPSAAPRYAKILTEDMVDLSDFEVAEAERLFRGGAGYRDVLASLNDARAEEGEAPIPRNRYTADKLQAIENRATGANRPQGNSTVGAQAPQAQAAPAANDPLAGLKQVAAIMELTDRIRGGNDVERIVAALQAKGLVGNQKSEDPELKFLGEFAHEGIDFLRDVAGKPKRDVKAYGPAFQQMSAKNAARRRQFPAGAPQAALPAPEGPTPAPAGSLQGLQPGPVPPAQEGPHAQGVESVEDDDWARLDYLDKVAHEKVFPYILDAQAGQFSKEQVLANAFQNGTLAASSVWVLAGDRKKPHMWDQTRCMRCESPKNAQTYSTLCPRSVSDREKLRRLAPETPKTLIERIAGLKGTVEATTPIPEFGNRSLWQHYVEDPVPELANMTIFNTIFSEEGAQWMGGFLEKLKECVMIEQQRSLPGANLLREPGPGPQTAQVPAGPPGPQVPVGGPAMVLERRPDGTVVPAGSATVTIIEPPKPTPVVPAITSGAQ